MRRNPLPLPGYTITKMDRGRVVATLHVPPVWDRPALKDPADIRAAMAEDMLERLGSTGDITRDDLTRFGWTAAQIDANHAAAFALCQHRADRRVRA